MPHFYRYRGEEGQGKGGQEEELGQLFLRLEGELEELRLENRQLRGLVDRHEEEIGRIQVKDSYSFREEKDKPSKFSFRPTVSSYTHSE